LVWIVARATRPDPPSRSAPGRNARPRRCHRSVEIDQVNQEHRLVACRLQQELRRRAIDIGLAGAGHPALAHHRGRTADRAAIFGEGFRPAADGEGIETALRLHSVERQLQPERPVELRLVDLVESGRSSESVVLSPLAADSGAARALSNRSESSNPVTVIPVRSASRSLS
jgi:hypothetical protein